MKLETATSIFDCLRIATEIAISWGDEHSDPTLDIWYRGVNDNYDLLPSAYWNSKAEEYSSFLTFTQLARNITETSGFNVWDYYCLARHHGIPTRLLDWSEGLTQSIFFAFDGWDGTTTPCIWIVRPDKINQVSVNLDAILLPNDFSESGRAASIWLPELKSKTAEYDGETWTNEKPIAIFPGRSNARVIGQLGTFTLHGTDSRPLNTILESESECEKFLARIDMVGLDPKETKRNLHYLGLRQSSIYPDADHVARDIGYMYGWGE